MADWTYSNVVPWWPYVFILLAGWLPTDIWRYLGVVSASRIDETSEAAKLARTIATALVAAVIAQLVFFPTGALADIPLPVRFGSLAAGFAAYQLSRRRILAGIIAAELVIGGWALVAILI
ncbi:AzlD domain-containing protein [Jiella sp. MQZ9-1]|uniref:AzlD domain-containing protein n=1 Tax=Jiella flava TaxID=2816857 RepID=A0A939FYA6_9HYPH|nr:AzlD domain-containing protein [Jiella flava]MBO0662233.1 AzlD domain-containing protein [Jiella flava]MCD2470936.1 AzlD domain-containing protein [Jiella flava]